MVLVENAGFDAAEFQVELADESGGLERVAWALAIL